MKVFTVLFLLSLFFASSQAQKKPVNEFLAIDKKMLSIPDSLTKTTSDISNYINSYFDTENEKIRAAFIWIASNIEYDIENMYTLNIHESKEDKIKKALSLKKGICEHYSILFDEICSNMGIKTFSISGYIKENNSIALPHAWNCAEVDGKWYLYDPTWAAGYTSNKKFYKKINNKYYKAAPTVMIKTHMPFDYMWQLLEYPITSQDFYDGKTLVDKTKPYFNYADSIKEFQLQNPVEQLKASAYRIEKNGIKNSLTFDMLKYIKIEIENIYIQAENKKQQENTDSFNSASACYNRAVKKFNKFVNYRNNKFSPGKSDNEIQEMLDASYRELEDAKEMLSQIKDPDKSFLPMMKDFSSAIKELSYSIDEQNRWLKNYFSKNKLMRKTMFFSKITLFGVPIK